VIGYIGLQFTSNTAHGPAQGLLPDMVPPEELGRGSAIKNMFDMLGLITASLLMGSFFHSDGSNFSAAVLLIAGILAAGTLITLFGAREAARPPAAGPRDSLRSMLRVNWSAAPGFAWLIVSRFVFLAGVYGIQAFAQYFIRDALHVADPVQLTGSLMAAIAVSLTLCAFGSGWLCDRIGRRPVHVIAGVLVAVGSLLIIGAHTAAAVLVCGVIIGSGIGIFLTANWALATDLAPQAEAGKFLGLTNIATAGAGAASRLMGPAIDGINNAAPGHFFGYTALFIVSAIFALLGLAVLLRVPERVNRGLAPAAKNADIEITSG
jgi:MFS family permease